MSEPKHTEGFVYTGERCLSGECAQCNQDHPDHAKAMKELAEMFGEWSDGKGKRMSDTQGTGGGGVKVSGGWSAE